MPQGETPTRDPSRRLNKLECGSKSVGLSSGLAEPSEELREGRNVVPSMKLHLIQREW